MELQRKRELSATIPPLREDKKRVAAPAGMTLRFVQDDRVFYPVRRCGACAPRKSETPVRRLAFPEKNHGRKPKPRGSEWLKGDASCRMKVIR